MRIRTTILLLMLLAFTAFVAGLVAMRRAESKSFDEVVRLRRARHSHFSALRYSIRAFR